MRCSMPAAPKSKARSRPSAIACAERLEDTRLRLSDLQHEGIERARRAARDTDEYVHEHPWHAVGAGAALGLLVGVLIARR